MIGLPAVGGLGPLAQLGFVVKDINEAMEDWRRAAGIESFICFESVVNSNTVHRGEPTSIDIGIAFAYASDDLEIEIICQNSGGPSPYREFIDSGREGLQHLAYVIDDCPTAWQRLDGMGLERVYSVVPESGYEIAYYDGPSTFGAMVEIVPGAWRSMREARRAFLRAPTTAPGIHRFPTMSSFYKHVGLI